MPNEIGRSMSYSYTIQDSITGVDVGDWDRVCASGGGSVFETPRFLAAVEASMSHLSRFWHVIVYDDQAAPVACASFSTFVVDVADTVKEAMKRRVLAIRRVLPPLTYLRILFCGLPVSAGQSNIVFAPGCDRERALRLLDEITGGLAVRERSQMVVYKEFGPEDLAAMDRLMASGYRRVETPSMYHFTPRFRDLAEYVGALTSHYRRLVRLSTQKVERGGIEVSCLKDADAIVSAYTPDVHRLYVAVAEKSDIRLEVHGVGFFHELARRLPEAVSLITLSRDSRILAFMWGLTQHGVYHSLFCGVDYELNERYDLYFNLEYATLDHALREGVTDIQLGQTAEVFKSRLGCYPRSLFMYAKGVGPLMSWLTRSALQVIVPPRPGAPTHRIFKSPVLEPERRSVDG